MASHVEARLNEHGSLDQFGLIIDELQRHVCSGAPTCDNRRLSRGVLDERGGVLGVDPNVGCRVG